MKKEVARNWVEALRSGEYKQGVNRLRKNDNSFCAFGVLCNLHAIAHPEFAKTQVNPLVYDGSYVTPSQRVRAWAQIKDVTLYSITELNDVDGYSFNKIADYIEQNYPDL